LNPAAFAAAESSTKVLGVSVATACGALAFGASALGANGAAGGVSAGLVSNKVLGVLSLQLDGLLQHLLPRQARTRHNNQLSNQPTSAPNKNHQKQHENMITLLSCY
jgi:hypothetical protein